MKKVHLVTLLTLFLAGYITSCKKPADRSNEGAKFVGTWVGNSTCNLGVATIFKIHAGIDGNTLIDSGTVGLGSCSVDIALYMKASGDKILIPTQTFSDNCGNTYTVQGSGNLSGSNLSLTQIYSGAVSDTCTFTGHK